MASAHCNTACCLVKTRGICTAYLGASGWGLAGGGGGIGWGVEGGCVHSKGLMRESSMWRDGKESGAEGRDGEEAEAEGRAVGRGASCELALLIWSLCWQPPLSSNSRLIKIPINI